MKIFLITLVLLGIGFAGIAIKLLVAGKVFSGTCASQNPKLNPNGEPCSFCGRTPEEQEMFCKKKIFLKKQK